MRIRYFSIAHIEPIDISGKVRTVMIAVAMIEFWYNGDHNL